MKSSFVYPAELVELLAKRWNSLQASIRGRAERRRGAKTGLEAAGPPFPTEDNLKLLLDTVYHASFLVEEGRKLHIRLLYVSPETCRNKHTFNILAEPFLFGDPVPLGVSDLLRLVPALDPFQSVLLICDDSELPTPTGKGHLVLWGILKLGYDWWKVLTGRTSGAVAPPNCLSISSQSAGQITATALGMVLVRLSGGRVPGVPLGSISNGVVGDFLQPSAERLYSDVLEELKVPRYHREADSDQHPRQEYFRALENIIRRAREKAHGATFVIFPDTVTHLDQRLRDRISLKHTFVELGVWDDLIRQSVAHHHYYRLLFPEKHVLLTSKPDAEPEQLKELIRWEEQLTGVNERIGEFESFVAALSGVDGCVALTTKLQVLGFGGEIIAQSPCLTHVRVAKDAGAQNTSDQSIADFGTRHRSAFRICSSFEECVAFVVSQDGGVKAVKRLGPDVVIWPDVTTGMYDL